MILFLLKTFTFIIRKWIKVTNNEKYKNQMPVYILPQTCICFAHLVWLWNIVVLFLLLKLKVCLHMNYRCTGFFIKKLVNNYCRSITEVGNMNWSTDYNAHDYRLGAGRNTISEPILTYFYMWIKNSLSLLKNIYNSANI